MRIEEAKRKGENRTGVGGKGLVIIRAESARTSWERVRE